MPKCLQRSPMQHSISGRLELTIDWVSEEKTCTKLILEVRGRQNSRQKIESPGSLSIYLSHRFFQGLRFIEYSQLCD